MISSFKWYMEKNKQITFVSKFSLELFLNLVIPDILIRVQTNYVSCGKRVWILRSLGFWTVSLETRRKQFRNLLKLHVSVMFYDVQSFRRLIFSWEDMKEWKTSFRLSTDWYKLIISVSKVCYMCGNPEWWAFFVKSSRLMQIQLFYRIFVYDRSIGTGIISVKKTDGFVYSVREPFMTISIFSLCPVWTGKNREHKGPAPSLIRQVECKRDPY